MDFISNKEPQIKEMLKAIGVNSIDDLFTAIPAHLRKPRPPEDNGLSEFEGIKLMESLAAKNRFPQLESYLGAGAYEHHIPALAGAICSKSEFLTAYTPYQAEASQGNLQTIFEYQTALCALTGLDASNASLYDGASACAEGLLMALRCQKERNKVLIAENVHPHYRAVVQQYLCHPEISVKIIPIAANGMLDQQRLSEALDDSVAGVLLQYPNFFGGIDQISAISSKIKSAGALTVLCANPLVYGLFASAGELGADIAVGDCQPLGLSLNYGGPYVGYITCRTELVRQLPGRLVGKTVDSKGRPGFVLTLQAREQHIRREKATSNICTNQALAALAVLVTLLWYGKEGIHKLALTNYQRAAYLKERLEAITEPSPFAKNPFFNEFVIKFPGSSKEVQQHFRAHGIEPGLSLSRFYPHLEGHFLVAVTETKNQQQLDHYIEVSRKLR